MRLIRQLLSMRFSAGASTRETSVITSLSFSALNVAGWNK